MRAGIHERLDEIRNAFLQKARYDDKANWGAGIAEIHGPSIRGGFIAELVESLIAGPVVRETCPVIQLDGAEDLPETCPPVAYAGIADRNKRGRRGLVPVFEHW